MKRKIKDYDSYVVIKGKYSQFQAFHITHMHMHVENENSTNTTRNVSKLLETSHLFINNKSDLSCGISTFILHII